MRRSIKVFLEQKAGYLLLSPTIVLLLALSVFPLVFSLSISFRDYNLALGTNRFVGFQNYATAFADRLFWRSLLNTVKFSAGSVLLTVIIGLGVAILLNRDIPGRRVFSALFIIPMMLTPAVIALFWRLLLNADYGPLNYYLSFIGVPPNLNWLGTLSLAMPSVILVDVWHWTPFVFLLFSAGLQSLPNAPYEAAKVDGASGWQVFRFVTIPLLRPIFMIVLLFRTIDAFRVFDKIYVLTLGGPGFSTEVLSMYTYKMGFKWFDMGYASALSYLMLIIMVFISQLYIRFLGKKEEIL